MTDLATLALAVDSRQVKEGVAELESLTAAGERAEKATGDLGKASADTAAKTKTASQAASEMAANAQAAAAGGTKFAQAYAAADVAIVNLANAQAEASREIATAKAAYEAGEASLEQYNAEILRTKAALSLVQTEHSQAMAALRKYSAANDDVAKATNGAAFAARNLNYQIMDMAQGFALGMPPMMILMQQVPQAADAFSMLAKESGGAGNAVASLAGKFGPILIVAGALAGAMALVTHEINENSKVTVTWKDVALGAYDAVLAKLKELADQGFTYLGTTSGEVLKGMVAAAKWGANAMIGSLIVVPRVVSTAFDVIPAAIGDVFFAGANLAIRAMNGLISKAVEIINGYINKANALIAYAAGLVPGLSGMQLPTLSAPQIGELENRFAGAGKRAASALVGAVKDTLTHDYVGDIADFISPFAQARAVKRTEDDAKKAGGSAGRKLGKEMADKAAEELAKFTQSIQDQLARTLGRMSVDFGKMRGDEWSKDWDEFMGRSSAANTAYVDQLNDIYAGLERIRDLTREIDLGSAFGNFGDALTNMSDIIRDMSAAQDEYNSKLLAAQAMQDGDAKMARIGELKAANSKNQLNNTVALIGASKRLFAEQSAGYKILEAAERAMMAVQLVSTAIHVAKGASKIFASLGPFGFPVVAAMLGVMASLGFKGGSSTQVAPPTAEQLQEQAGTGTVLGDPTAKSNSIANSLEIIASNTNRDLEYSNSMLVALRSIDSGITKLSGNVARQITVAGGMFDTSGANLGSSGSGGFLGLFSSSTTRELWDLGMDIFSSSVADILQGGIAGRTYQIVQQIKKKSGFLGIGGGTKTTYETTYGGIDPTITDAINGVIYSLRQGLIEGAKVIGLDGAAAIIDNFRVEIGRLSFKDMTGEEIEKQLNAVFSSVGDQMAGAILPSLKEIQKVGEGLFETFMRAARQYQVVDISLKSIGLQFGMVGVESLGARDALVQMFESLDEFVSQTDFYRQNFLTDAERMAPIISSVADEMVRLGLAGVDTIAEFKGVIDSLDLTSEAGRTMYASLMAVAPAFSSIIKYQDKLAKSYDDQAASLRNYLNDLLGKGSASSLATAAAQFRGTATQALLGDLDALGALKGASNTFLDAAKANAKTPLDYARARAEVLRTVSQAASAADSQAEMQRKQLAAAEALAADVAAMRTEQNQINATMANSLSSLNNQLGNVIDGDAIKVTSDGDQPFTVDVAA